MKDSTGSITADVGPTSIGLIGILMTAVQLAAHFKTTPRTIARWAEEPDFPCASTSASEVMWLLTDVQEWNRQRRRTRAALRSKEKTIEKVVEKAGRRQRLIAAFSRRYPPQIRRSAVLPLGAPLSRKMIVQADGSLAPAPTEEQESNEADFHQ
ncbi:hypothetical protein HAP48_0023140 [Bradyrhizobium septentrionale]|uniref:Uncharacterized protein n=1 Tax=Bradyrhizobium septentrionale TaxID=1404411 RepID=A0A973VWH7_9BRAD|nr:MULTISPECIES: hypothetical protein [Bradyrhizobium]UGY20106.1 hypothetical protein HAP48_0023140 [Bradyrhizobium septentrionale]UGY28957.1 hypothetical protein HU675_0020520 [Bradyrhizobium septentrionale]